MFFASSCSMDVRVCSDGTPFVPTRLTRSFNQTQNVYAAPNNSPSKIARDVQATHFPNADKTTPLIVMVTNSAAVSAPGQVRALLHASHVMPYMIVIGHGATRCSGTCVEVDRSWRFGFLVDLTLWYPSARACCLTAVKCVYRRVCHVYSRS